MIGTSVNVSNILDNIYIYYVFCGNDGELNHILYLIRRSRTFVPVVQRFHDGEYYMSVQI